MTEPSDDVGQRERWSSSLSLTPGERLIALADECLAGDDRCRVIRVPEVGSVDVQVREPIAGHRFLLSDMVVTSAEVDYCGTVGWAMRAGGDRHAALAQAICEAELVRRGPLAARINEALAEADGARDTARAEHWSELQPTIVEFEEVL